MDEDVSRWDALVAVVAAALVIVARWTWTHWPWHQARATRAEAWAEGFRAGVLAATTGRPQPNPYDLPGLDVRQDT
jgi:hypothetical protein